jgi:hypothetical protein
MLFENTNISHVAALADTDIVRCNYGLEEGKQVICGKLGVQHWKLLVAMNLLVGAS